MMKSTGETMAIGRTFEEALMKAMRSLEVKIPKAIRPAWHLNPATDQRLFAVFEAFRRCMTVDELYRETKINKWFLEKIRAIVSLERELADDGLNSELLLRAKQTGYSDSQIANFQNMSESDVRSLRKKYGIGPTYKMVDSCAAEFQALTPYYYSTYEKENEAISDNGRKVLVIGSGPIRIGQGIEFDYCCSHAAFALKDRAVKSIMVNNNPETVSTDFDSSDRLYFEPLTFEDVMNIVENEKPEGVIVQFGGQTSLNLAHKLSDAGVKILGTQLDYIDIAENRERFRALSKKLEIPQPSNGTATSEKEAHTIANEIGYPVVVRPSYVISGRGMAIVYTDNELTAYISETEVSTKKPVLIDKYLDNAIEAEVDAVCDGTNLFIGAIMEHIEPAGVHSGDANIVLPPVRLEDSEKNTIEMYTEKISKALHTIGIINIQYAVKDGVVYILEANPRASRTVPFVSKAVGVPLVKLATYAMLGEKLPKVQRHGSCFAVKSVVFPFLKLSGTDIRLGPEMRSTGETMGFGKSFELAYYKALLAAGVSFTGKEKAALVSVNNYDKKHLSEISKLLNELGFVVYATPGTAAHIPGASKIPKIGQAGSGEKDVLQLIRSGKIGLILNTPTKGGDSQTDGFRIRRAAIEKGIPCMTTMSTAIELFKALKKLKTDDLEIRTVDEWVK